MFIVFPYDVDGYVFLISIKKTVLEFDEDHIESVDGF